MDNTSIIAQNKLKTLYDKDNPQGIKAVHFTNGDASLSKGFILMASEKR
jgi:hypothetical protein